VIADARAHRQEIVAARERAAAATRRGRFESGLPDPMLMTNLDHLPVMLDGANVSFMVQQQVPLSGVLGAIERRDDAQAEALSADVGRLELDVEADALLAFVMLAEEQSMRKVIADQLALADSVAKVAEARLAGGAGVPADAVRASLERTRIEADLDAKEAEIAAADAMLDAALGRAPDAAIPDCVLEVSEDAPAAATRAAGARPELRAMKRRVVAAEEDVEVMRNMRAPMGVFGVGGAYTMTDGAGFMATVGVSIPLDWGKYDAGIDEASSMVSMERSDLSAMETMIAGEAEAGRQRVLAARARAVAIRTKVLPQAQQTFEVSLGSYGGGQLPIVSVLESVALLREVQMAEVATRAELGRAWVRLGRATAQPGLGLVPPTRGPR
jgi:cobalt-zinc-cadmium efflux system outer membrane protein